MQNYNRQLIDWLYCWGDWRERPVHGLGYPSMTQDARLYCSPGRSSQKDYCPEYKKSPIEQMVEKAMLEINPDFQIVLWWQYVSKKGVVGIQEYNNCSRSAARWKLKKAHHEIAKALNVDLYCMRAARNKVYSGKM